MSITSTHRAYPSGLARAVGQIALLATVANGVWALAGIAARCLDTTFPICAHLAPEWIALKVAESVAPVLAGVTFWASLRHDRARLAVSGAVLIAVLQLVVPAAWAALVNASWTTVPGWIAGQLWLLGAMALLAASYRPPTTLADAAQTPRGPAPGRLWIGVVLVPLITAMWPASALLAYTPTVLCLFTASALYGAMLRIRPVPGAASWTAVALTSVLLALPWQAYLALTFHHASSTPRIMLAATVAAAAGLAGWQLYQTRRQPQSAAGLHAPARLRRAPGAAGEGGVS